MIRFILASRIVIIIRLFNVIMTVIVGKISVYCI